MSQRLPPNRRDKPTDTDSEDPSVSVPLEIYDEDEHGQVSPEEGK